MKRLSRGFTLLELMVALTILAILLGWGVPTFREFTRNNSVLTAQNDLVTSLNLARSEALRRNRPISVCATADGSTCGVAGDWPLGWMAFVDRDAPGEVDGDDEILQYWQSSNNSLIYGTSGATFVQYLSTGMVEDPVTFEINWDGCTGGDRRRRISVIATGAVTSETISCAS